MFVFFKYDFILKEKKKKTNQQNLFSINVSVYHDNYNQRDLHLSFPTILSCEKLTIKKYIWDENMSKDKNRKKSITEFSFYRRYLTMKTCHMFASSITMIIILFCQSIQDLTYTIESKKYVGETDLCILSVCVCVFCFSTM
jgi:hypothetical protein